MVGGTVAGAFAASLGLEGEGYLVGMSDDDSLEAIIARATRAGLMKGDADEALVRRKFRVFQAHQRALIDYRAGPYDGKAVFFQSREENRAHGWLDLIKDLEIYDCPGGHNDVLSGTSVRVIATVLRDLLQDSKPIHSSQAESRQIE